MCTHTAGGAAVVVVHWCRCRVEVTIRGVLPLFLHITFETGSLTQLETILVRLAGYWAPRSTCLYPSRARVTDTPTTLVCECRGSKLRSSSLLQWALYLLSKLPKPASLLCGFCECNSGGGSCSHCSCELSLHRNPFQKALRSGLGMNLSDRALPQPERSHIVKQAKASWSQGTKSTGNLWFELEAFDHCDPLLEGLWSCQVRKLCQWSSTPSWGSQHCVYAGCMVSLR